MHFPFEHHWGAVKHLLHYLNDMRSLGIRLLVDTLLTLHGFSNANWAGNLDDHTSTSAFLIFLGANPIPRILQSNTILLVLPLGRSIVQL